MAVSPYPLPMPAEQLAMTLVMPLADPSYHGLVQLGAEVFHNAGPFLKHNLDLGGTAHFARFVIIGENLVMVASFDGGFGDYIEMFIHTIGDIFDDIMRFVVDPPPTPVKENPGQFVDWVRAHCKESIGFYSGYPNATVQQIRAALGMSSKAAFVAPSTSTLPPDQIADVQGLILRGLGQPLARHFVMAVTDAGRARKAIGAMAAVGSTGGVQITGGADWGADKPDTSWAVGITATGLLALGVPEASVETFPIEFREGSPARSSHVGDWGTNAPEFWHGGLGDASQVHVVASLYAADSAALERGTTTLTNATADAFRVVSSFDAAKFSDGPFNVHFGYRDNISQPNIDGGPAPHQNDQQTLAAAGEFVLGYPSQYGGITLDVPQPVELGHNGSFTAFRILEQDVAGFESFLDVRGAFHGVSPELLAAKVMGRWRNGVPLELSPLTDQPFPPVLPAELNNYGYASDPDGLRCPIGAHMRRGNPRDQPMTPFDDSGARRIMRRAMPYGPEWKAGDGRDDVERGLVGHFIGASLLLQFETIMGQWMNRGRTSPKISSTNDVILGVEEPWQSFDIPTKRADGSVDPKGILLVEFGQFVRTRGSIYAFLPSLTALRWIGSL